MSFDRLSTALWDRYRIERQIGSGGMAVVYLARDIRHQRNVAVKVLRPELAAVVGAERFLNEIKVTANLQHPNILQLFDSGEADSFLYYVMPHVEGESVRQKLNREMQLPIDEAIAITKAVASALDYAHRQGVIHRDIKPENILLHDGQAVVADFGISLAVSAAGGSRLTETGLSLGTPQYMSPEQAMDSPEPDARSDVYSLGATTYEMLVGDPPFTGPTAQAIMAKVMTEPAPSATASRDTVPRHVSAAIQKALAKLPADRFGSASRFVKAMENPDLAATQEPFARPPAPYAAVARWLWPGATLALVALAAWGWLRPQPPRRVMRFDVVLPPFGLVDIGRTTALSPDGSKFVHISATDRGLRRMYLRGTDQLTSTLLSGTNAGPISPFFSPDGRSLGFGTFSYTMVKVDIAGGPFVTLADSVALSGGDWGRDGRIYFTHAATRGLARVPATGGPVERLAAPDTTRGETEYRWPAVLPNGHGVLFTIWHAAESEAEIGVLDLRTGTVTVLTPGTSPRYARTGHMVYCRLDGTLMAVPFDEGRLELAGLPTALEERVVVKLDGGAEVSIAEDGTMMYQRGGALNARPVRVFRDGSEEPLDLAPSWYTTPRIAPDGQRVALVVGVTGAPFLGDLWTYNMRDSTLSRLTFDGQAAYPEWSLDGRRISFSSLRHGDRDLYSVPADGSQPPQLVFQRPLAQWEGMVTPDGRWLAYREAGGETGRDIRYRSLVTPGLDSAFQATSNAERSLALSRDGRWLAYVSDESGQDEVYVRPFPGGGGRLQISTDGGIGPVWAHNGRELFYSTRESLVSVNVAIAGDDLRVESRRALFDIQRYFISPNYSGYDIFPDDRSFLFARTEREGDRSVVVVVNFFEELKGR
jgi:Tol biopolymer transport system component